jgi:hypothetical protein
LFHRFDTLGSHLREEGSLGYDGGLVRLQVQTNFDTNIYRQQAATRSGGGVAGGGAMRVAAARVSGARAGASEWTSVAT